MERARLWTKQHNFTEAVIVYFKGNELCGGDGGLLWHGHDVLNEADFGPHMFSAATTHQVA